MRLKSSIIFYDRTRKRSHHFQKSTEVILSTFYQHFEIPPLWLGTPKLLLSNDTPFPNNINDRKTTVRSVKVNIAAITWQIVTCSMEDHKLFRHIRANGRGRGAVLFSFLSLMNYFHPSSVLRFMRASWCWFLQYLALTPTKQLPASIVCWIIISALPSEIH